MGFSPTERAIIEHLYHRGDDRPVNIAEASGYHRNSVSRSMNRLEEDAIVRSKGNGVWTLTPAGMEEARSLRQDD